MTEDLYQFIKNIPSRELAVMVIAALPISELRGSIPLALGTFHFSIYKSFILSIIGNILPVVPLLFCLESISQWLIERFAMAKKFFDWLFARTRKRSTMVEKYGALGLILFVAIPLPVTGAWTGSVAAFLLGIRKRWAALCISTGVIVAGIIVTALTKLGVFIINSL